MDLNSVKEKYDLVAIGEILMDMTPTLLPGEEGKYAYTPNPGGAPCNVAVMAAHLGTQVACVSKVGEDIFGEKLLETLKENNIDTRFVVKSGLKPTTLAFVHLDNYGERSFSFYRSETADVSLSLEEVKLSDLLNTKVICYGSVAMSKSPLRETCFEILKAASIAGVLLAYDPNHRPLLWDDPTEGVAMMQKGLEFANILKVSEEEALLISGEDNLDKAMTCFLKKGIGLVAITMGSKGVLVGLKSKSIKTSKEKASVGTNQSNHYIRHFSSFNVELIQDTTGAGDAFFGALLASLIEKDMIRENQDHFEFYVSQLEDLELCIKRAQAAAALCIGKLGAIPAMPTREEVLAFIK